MGELFRIALGMAVVELRNALKRRAKARAEQDAFARGPAQVTVRCDVCGASVPAHDIAMAAHRRLHEAQR